MSTLSINRLGFTDIPREDVHGDPAVVLVLEGDRDLDKGYIRMLIIK